MNNKGMFYTNVDDYKTKEDMMNDFIALRMYDMSKDKEIERLHSIIKEAREYMNNLRWFEMFTKEHDITLYASTKNFYRDIKEILDKAEEKE